MSVSAGAKVVESKLRRMFSAKRTTVFNVGLSFRTKKKLHALRFVASLLC